MAVSAIRITPWALKQAQVQASIAVTLLSRALIEWFPPSDYLTPGPVKHLARSPWRHLARFGR